MHWIKRAFVLFLLLWSGVSLAQTIDAMRLSETPSSGVRFVADLDDKADVKVFRLENPSRLVMDFSRTRFGQKIAPLSPTGFIKGFRTGQPNAQTARIVLDLPAFELTEKHFLLSPQTGKNWRFVLDIDKVKKNKTSPKETAIPSKKSIPTKKIIVLDPGHGGQDPGAISISGKYEKDLTLKMAKETKVLLEKQGYKVVLTRDKDFYIPLRGRIKKAHEANADLFISIHADSAKNKTAQGLSIYTISETASDKEAAALAERENKADILFGMDLTDYQPEVGNILIDFAKKYAMDQSSIYADFVVDEMKKEVNLREKAHRFAGFVVLKSPNIPSVLLEMGYLSNPKEDKLMQRADYRKKLGMALTKAVNAYFKKLAD
ncbi:MAG: N-acetylmuramoyl-L-alanine amidase [Alphaproteobacteria bacterium]|nr:N-acetylmuramoyl-L-alanine amidase [Alphaproteobacteria bacterium]